MEGYLISHLWTAEPLPTLYLPKNGYEEVWSYKIVNDIAKKIAYRLGREYQIVYAVHETQSSPHFHFVMNSVSYVDGHRYYGTKKEHHAMMDVIRDVLKEYCIKELRYISNA